jgi:hypothetical protein
MILLQELMLHQETTLFHISEKILRSSIPRRTLKTLRLPLVMSMTLLQELILHQETTLFHILVRMRILLSPRKILPTPRQRTVNGIFKETEMELGYFLLLMKTSSPTIKPIITGHQTSCHLLFKLIPILMSPLSLIQFAHQLVALSSNIKRRLLDIRLTTQFQTLEETLISMITLPP